MFRLDKVQFKIIESKLNKHHWRQIQTQKMYKRLPLPKEHVVYAHPKYYPFRSIIIVRKKTYTDFFLPKKLSWNKLINLIELGMPPSNKKVF